MRDQRTRQTLAGEFLTIYNELDVYMRERFRCRDAVSHIFLIDRLSERNSVLRSFKEELKEYARLRNAIVHNPYMREADPIAEPHLEIVRRYGILKDKILNPPKAMVVAVPAARIYSTTMEAGALDVVRTMNQKVYSYVPVLDAKNRIAGIFSENVIFSYLAKNEACAIGASAKISDFKEFIPVEKHSSEYFEFVPRNTLLAAVKEKFEYGLAERKRLGVVYITDNGRQNGLLLGMITAWDMAGNEKAT